MNNGNILLLREKLRLLGFGDLASSHYLELETLSGAAAFQLSTAAGFDKRSLTRATLFFKLSDKLDCYFLIKYEVLLIYNIDPIQTRKQTFYIKNGDGISFKEAFNLLQGRSVYTTLWDADNVKYFAWIQLSFSEGARDNANYKIRQFEGKHGFDLEKALDTYPIRELQDKVSRTELIRSLQQGNLYPATFIKADKVEKMFIEACPATKGLKIYSEAMKAVQKHSGKRVK